MMEFKAKIYKDGKFWLVDIPDLDAMTQGKTRKEALLMAKSLVFEMSAAYFSDEVVVDFQVNIIDYQKNSIGITANDAKLLLALSQQRLS